MYVRGSVVDMEGILDEPSGCTCADTWLHLMALVLSKPCGVHGLDQGCVRLAPVAGFITVYACW